MTGAIAGLPDVMKSKIDVYVSTHKWSTDATRWSMAMSLCMPHTPPALEMMAVDVELDCAQPSGSWAAKVTT